MRPASRRRSSNLRAIGVCAAIAVGASLLLTAPGALAGPENDSFSARADLGESLPVDLTESNEGATQQPDEWFGPSATGHSIWWERTSPAGEMITVGSCESDFPTLLAALEGAALGHQRRIGAVPADPACGSAGEEFSFYATAGATYAIGVDGNGYYRLGRLGGPPIEPPSGEGRVTLRIEPSP